MYVYDNLFSLYSWCINSICTFNATNQDKSEKQCLLPHATADRKKTFRAVCFSSEKHHKCKAITELYLPVKITNYQIKRNNCTEDKIHINKRSRLEDPNTTEVSFDVKPQAAQSLGSVAELSTVVATCWPF